MKKLIKSFLQTGFNDNLGYGYRPRIFYPNGTADMCFVIVKRYKMFWVIFEKMIDICEDMDAVNEYKRSHNFLNLKWIS